MNEQAFHAIRAARNWNMWGAFMAKAYAKKRNVHPSCACAPCTPA